MKKVKYVYVLSIHPDSRISHIDKWQCNHTCDTCNKKFICWTRRYLNTQEWNLGKNFPFMIYKGTVKRDEWRVG